MIIRQKKMRLCEGFVVTREGAQSTEIILKTRAVRRHIIERMCRRKINDPTFVLTHIYALIQEDWVTEKTFDELAQTRLVKGDELTLIDK